MKKSLWVAAAAAALTACGGGSHNNGIALPIPSAPAPAPAPAPDPDPAPAPAPAPEPAARTARYQALPASDDAAALRAELQAQGSNGWRYVGPMAWGEALYSLYVHDAETTYSYEFLTPAAGASDSQDQMNAQGARGFRFAGSFTLLGETYRKDNQSSATFDYHLLSDSAAATANDKLATANTEGSNGYYLVATFGFGAAMVDLFERTSDSSASYAYELLEPADGAEGFIAQLNAQGARGFRYKSGVVMGGTPGNLFERDTAQTSTFAYGAWPSQDSATDSMAQANAQGALGSMWIGDITIGSATQTYYFTPGACSGLLCDTRSPFGF